MFEVCVYIKSETACKREVFTTKIAAEIFIKNELKDPIITENNGDGIVYYPADKVCKCILREI